MNEKTAHLIRVGVETSYLPEQSSPGADRFAFAYTITIRNEGGVAAKLLNRHWVITDANGKVQEVRGEGVVGEQPYLRPGEGFQYTSGTLLDTPVGSMEGEYEMEDDTGKRFLAPIPAFSLSAPRTLH
jgi:ApaG protein